MLRCSYRCDTFFIGPLVCQIIFNACGRLVHNLKKYTGQEIVAGCLGLVTGTFMASLINNLLSLVNIAWFTVTFSVLSYLFFAFVGMAIGINYLKGVIVSQDVADGRISKILDASALIDGRIAEVAKRDLLKDLSLFRLLCFHSFRPLRIRMIS